MPTPAAVLSAMELLAKGTETEKGLGDLVAVDVGGATTDVYSMSLGEPTGVNTVIKGLPEPYAKRTVEGDIGMRYSASGVVEAAGIQALCSLSGLSQEKAEELMDLITSETDTLPKTPELAALDFALASLAVKIGMTRSRRPHREGLYACRRDVAAGGQGSDRGGKGRPDRRVPDPRGGGGKDRPQHPVRPVRAVLTETEAG